MKIYFDFSNHFQFNLSLSEVNHANLAWSVSLGLEFLAFFYFWNFTLSRYLSIKLIIYFWKSSIIELAVYQILFSIKISISLPILLSSIFYSILYLRRKVAIRIGIMYPVAWLTYTEMGGYTLQHPPPWGPVVMVLNSRLDLEGLLIVKVIDNIYLATLNKSDNRKNEH